MNRTVLVAAAALAVGGVATVQAFVISSRPDVSPPPAEAMPERAASPARTPDRVPPPIVRAASQAPSELTRHAPVPLLLKPRAAVVAEWTSQAEEPSSDDDGFDDRAAKAAIEADGYKGVKILRKGEGGVWHATGLRGKTTVMLSVDSSGAVTAD
ncbi:MAG: hypothetical protein ACOY4R_00670 [Pseudomonadota bacterium]